MGLVGHFVAVGQGLPAFRARRVTSKGGTVVGTITVATATLAGLALRTLRKMPWTAWA